VKREREGRWTSATSLRVAESKIKRTITIRNRMKSRIKSKSRTAAVSCSFSCSYSSS
jgi:hypothetical protein